jgi:hypothetical protein
MGRRQPVAAVLIGALALVACRSPDYSYAREHRFDRPYQGGAAIVSDTPDPPRHRTTAAEGLGCLAYFGLLAAAILGGDNVGFYVADARQPPPPPPERR